MSITKKNNQQNLGYLLSKAARLTKWDLNTKLNEIGITSTQWGVLHLLYQVKDTDFLATPANIAEQLHSDRPTVSGIIDRLYKQGWVNRDVNPDDRRSQLITLTDKTLDFIPQMEKLSDETMEAAVNGFTKEELDLMGQFLSRVISNLTKQS